VTTVNKKTVSDVFRILDELVADNPERVDRRSQGLDQPPLRYVENGQPNCLVAVLLHRLGVSVGVLRQLDREGGKFGGGILLWATEHAIRRRFTKPAWLLLDALQGVNDLGCTWKRCADAARDRGHWMARRSHGHVWLDEE
jgi:hypothetical protein